MAYGLGTLCFDFCQTFVSFAWLSIVFPWTAPKGWPDGTVYEGLWKAGRKHGKGTLQEPGGRSYVGEWADGKRHGVGVQVLATIRTYAGSVRMSHPSTSSLVSKASSDGIDLIGSPVKHNVRRGPELLKEFINCLSCFVS